MPAYFRFCRLCLSLLILILSFSCKKTSSPDNNPPNDPPPAVTPVGTPVGNPASKNIGAAGGTLVSPDGRLELNIPAGALSSNTDISIQPVTNEAPGGLGLAYDLLPDGTKFSKPATITFHYTTDEVNDNIPYFLYISYQDSINRWRTDKIQRDFDTVAKSVSLDISHFTIFSLQDGITMTAKPNTLHTNEESIIEVQETTVSADGLLTESDYLPDELVWPWKATVFNAPVGTISPEKGSVVNYKAPSAIDVEKNVKVTALIRVKTTVYRKGKKELELPHYERSVNIKLKPYHEYNYKIYLYVIDSTLSGFYGGLKEGLPIYLDTANFKLNLRVNKSLVTATLSDPINGPPGVVPPTKSFQGIDYVWLADPFGEINITGLSQNSIALPDDSVLVFSLLHSNANYPGGLAKSSETGEVFGNSPPQPFTGSLGIPQIFELDLKRRGPYIKTNGFYGQYVKVAIVPE